jgi:hypothetical protein
MKMGSVSVRVVRENRPISVIGWHDQSYPGLAVLRDPKDGSFVSHPWSVFHTASGLCAVPDSIGGFRTREQAVQYARALAGIAGELGFTWRVSFEAISGTCLDAARSRVLEYVRSILRSGKICEGVLA